MWQYIRDRCVYVTIVDSFTIMEFNRRFSIGLISLIFCAFICWSNGTEFEEFRTVDTALGKIRGKRDITWINNEVFYSFKGIPYAKTPIGNLRLKVSE